MVYGAVYLSIMKSSIGYSEFKEDFSTHSWLTWCNSEVPMWLLPVSVIFFFQGRAYNFNTSQSPTVQLNEKGVKNVALSLWYFLTGMFQQGLIQAEMCPF